MIELAQEDADYVRETITKICGLKPNNSPTINERLPHDLFYFPVGPEGIIEAHSIPIQPGHQIIKPRNKDHNVEPF